MTEAESTFLKTTVPAALASQQATGVPASITLAQAILESGWGRSGLARGFNNYFGIKAADHAAPDSYIEMPTHEIYDGQNLSETAKFARYATPADGFKAHACLLAQAPRYAQAMAVREQPAAFAIALHACGYSTNPNYPALLMQLVNQFDLAQYDSQPTGNSGQQTVEGRPAAPAEGV